MRHRSVWEDLHEAQAGLLRVWEDLHKVQAGLLRVWEGLQEVQADLLRKHWQTVRWQFVLLAISC